MLKSLTIAVFFTAVSLASFAQNWQPAKLFLHDGDSIDGEIDFADWQVSPATVTFRNNGNVRAYDHNELNYFFVNERMQRYQLVRARLKYYNTVPFKAGGSPIDHEDSVSVYSEVLYSNDHLALYSLQDSWQDERLFIVTEGEVRELIHYTITFVREGRNVSQEINSYREQLKALLKDCEVGINSSMVYSSRSIIPVLRKYSTCKGYEQSVERVEQRGLLSMGAFAGTASIKDWYYDVSDGTYIVGADFQLLSKRNHNNNFIWLELGYFPELKGVAAYLQPLVFGLYGGRYFGKGHVQPVLFTGLSSLNRAFDTGGGIAFSKRLIVCGSFSLMTTTTSLIQETPWMLYTFKVKFYPHLRR